MFAATYSNETINPTSNEETTTVTRRIVNNILSDVHSSSSLLQALSNSRSYTFPSNLRSVFCETNCGVLAFFQYLSGAVRRRVNRVCPPSLTLFGTPAEPGACPVMFHVTPTPVYAGWWKVNIRWIAAPLVGARWLIHALFERRKRPPVRPIF